MDEMTIFWLILAIVMAVLEAVTVQLVSIWFAVGSAAACIASLITDNVVVQVAVFVVVTAIALAVTRPLAKKLRQKKTEPTNADRYIGRTAVVLTAVDNEKAQGMVRVDNEKWTARSEGGDVLPQGAVVTVTAIRGVKLIVKQADSQPSDSRLNEQ